MSGCCQPINDRRLQPYYIIDTENYSIDFFPSFVGTGNQCRLHATIEIDATTELLVKPDLVEKN